jgi:hypothetical protein
MVYFEEPDDLEDGCYLVCDVDDYPDDVEGAPDVMLTGVHNDSLNATITPSASENDEDDRVRDVTRLEFLTHENGEKKCMHACIIFCSWDVKGPKLHSLCSPLVSSILIAWSLFVALCGRTLD